MRDYDKELYSNKGNEIIQNYAWDLKEKQLKIMELLCSCYMTNYYDAEKNTITVGVADFMRELGLTTTGISAREYRRFETAIKKLSDTSIIGIGFNGKRRIIRLINTADFPTEERDTTFVCHMSEDFKECMKLQAKGNTKIEFRTICDMNSRFSIKLYNLLRSWQGKDEVYFDLDYLKELLNVTAKSYSNYAKFRQAVLDVAVDEINEKTSLKVEYKGLKNRGSSKVTKVVFKIYKTPLIEKSEENYSLDYKDLTYEELFENEYYYQKTDEGCTTSMRLTKEFVAKQTGKLHIYTKIKEGEDGPFYFAPYKEIDCDEINEALRGFSPTPSDEEEYDIDDIDDVTDFSRNPLSLTFKNSSDKKTYIEEYLDNLTDKTLAMLARTVPREIHEFDLDCLTAIKVIISSRLPFHIPANERIYVIDDVVSRFTLTVWNPIKSKNTKYAAKSHYLDEFRRWVDKNYPVEND